MKPSAIDNTNITTTEIRNLVPTSLSSRCLDPMQSARSPTLKARPLRACGLRLIIAAPSWLPACAISCDNTVRIEMATATTHDVHRRRQTETSVAKPEFDIVVIGAGAGGLVVAAGGASLGAKVALV